MMPRLNDIISREDGWLAPSQWQPPELSWKRPTEEGRRWCTRNDRFICLRLSMAAFELTGIRFPYQLIDEMVDYCMEPVAEFSHKTLIYKLRKAEEKIIHVYFPLFIELQPANIIEKQVRWRSGYINRKEFFDQITPLFIGDYWDNCMFGWRASNDKRIKQVVFYPGHIWSDNSIDRSYLVIEDKKYKLRFPIVSQNVFMFSRTPILHGRPL